MDKELQRFVDEAAIKKVHIRYCRGVDRMDWELLRSCYHPDAIDDHGEYVGGVDGFIEYCKQGTPNFLGTCHFTGNQLVEVDGDTAWAEHHGIAYHRVAGKDGKPEKDLITVNRWIDRMEKRNGEWRIAHRKVVVDMDRVDPILAQWVPQNQLIGRRDKTDPSYKR
jgi:hypothetical protein